MDKMEGIVAYRLIEGMVSLEFVLIRTYEETSALEFVLKSTFDV